MRPHPPQCCSSAHHVFLLPPLLNPPYSALSSPPPSSPFCFPSSPLFPDGHINSRPFPLVPWHTHVVPPAKKAIPYPSSPLFSIFPLPAFPQLFPISPFPFVLLWTSTLTLSSLRLLCDPASTWIAAKCQPLNSISLPLPCFSLYIHSPSDRLPRSSCPSPPS